MKSKYLEEKFSREVHVMVKIFCDKKPIILYIRIVSKDFNKNYVHKKSICICISPKLGLICGSGFKRHSNDDLGFC